MEPTFLPENRADVDEVYLVKQNAKNFEFTQHCVSNNAAINENE